jgi:outer membrane autotransporter protein
MIYSRALLFTLVVLGYQMIEPSAGAAAAPTPPMSTPNPTPPPTPPPTPVPTPTPTPTPPTPTPTPGTPAFPKRTGLSPNQKAVYDLIKGREFDARAAKLIAALKQSGGSFPHDLDLIAPTGLTAAFELGITLADIQAAILQRRMDEIHSGAGGFGPPGEPGANGPSFSDSLAVSGPNGPDGKDGKSVAPNLPDNRWGVFLTGMGDFTSVGSHDGYDLTTGGFTLGVDYKLTPHLAIGVLAGYAGTGTDLPNSGRIFVNSGTVGLYGTYFQGGFYVDTAVSGGYNGYDSRRSGFGGDARGSTDGGQLDVLFATGYDFKFGSLTIGPTATFQYTDVKIDGFSERGSLAPLNVGSQSSDSLTSAFGIKISYDWKLGGVMVRPELRASWQHEYGDQSYEIDSTLGSLGGGSFTVHGPEIGRDSLLIGAGFSIQWNERVSTYLYYDGDLGRENYTSHNVSGGVRVNF